MFSISCKGTNFCRTPVLGLGLEVDFTFTWDNNNNKNPHLNFLNGAVLGDKEQWVGIRDKGQGIRPKWSSTLKTKSCITLEKKLRTLILI